MYVHIRVKDLRDYGVPEFAIGQLKSIGRVYYSEGEEYLSIYWAILVASLVLWVACGIITTWIFTAILHALKIAPWQIWK